ncbi:hypothetical protein BSL78_18211 [Apostichopus japonicus]|uniref:DUSP domain-containing protein n=1 Tax=Stichopus japonicus TaxID=307972 RepID=A0A2G8KAB2_STIJA|nr:hypothetical protein BSL78_18211 [Apostichopus japonicus]
MRLLREFLLAGGSKIHTMCRSDWDLRKAPLVPRAAVCRVVTWFGGGPVVNHLSLNPCGICQAEILQLTRRRDEELNKFVELHEAFTSNNSRGDDIYYISLAWFNQWEAFVKAKEQDPPGPIDNKPIAIIKDGHAFNRPVGGSAQISEDTWKYFSIYDGGPEIILHASRPALPDTLETEDEEEEDEEEQAEETIAEK